jgi:hypothetical protein
MKGMTQCEVKMYWHLGYPVYDIVVSSLASDCSLAEPETKCRGGQFAIFFIENCGAKAPQCGYEYTKNKREYKQGNLQRANQIAKHLKFSKKSNRRSQLSTKYHSISHL